jgi:hypothetical protein
MITVFCNLRLYEINGFLFFERGRTTSRASSLKKQKSDILNVGQNSSGIG